MADLTTTQLKLRTTPTAGVSSEQSPFFRRLLSAGYKGFLQGTVGGSTLYGALGMAAGALVGIPLAIFLGGLLPLLAIPVMAGIGLYKGYTTFGHIASVAAITAEGYEMNERRRHLLDRYYDLPDTPEHDEEAGLIQKLLVKQNEPKAPPAIFHLRPMLVGALLGGVIALGFLTIGPAIFGTHFFLNSAIAAMGVVPTATLGIGAGTALGATTGAMIGLDRYYVRSWLDKTASVMHDTKSIEEQIAEREREIEQLGRRSPVNESRDKVTDPKAAGKIHLVEPEKPIRDVSEFPARPCPISPRQIAGLETPGTHASAIEHQDRVVSIQEAMARPVV